MTTNQKYRYGMRVRGRGFGCQPRDFLEFENDATNKYLDIVIYDRKLTDKEIQEYSLVKLEEPKQIIIVKETLIREVEVDPELSVDEAIEKVQDMYRDQEIVLDTGDFKEAEFLTKEEYDKSLETELDNEIEKD